MPIERAMLAAGVRLRLAGLDREIEPQPAQLPAREVGLVADGLRAQVAGGLKAPDVDIDLEAGVLKPIAVDIAVPDETPLGGVHTFDVTQTNAKGQIVGGARLVAVTVPKELMG